jgi:hypothetical protein
VLPATLLHLRLAHGHLPSCHYFTVQSFVICVNIWIMLTDSSPVFSCLRRLKWMLSSKSLIKPLKSRIANSTLPSFTRFLNPIDSPMFHLAMGWNFSAHVSFCNGLEWLRPCFISQLLVLNGAFHLRSCWCSTGVPSSFSFAVAWIFRAICISLWLGFSELFVFRCGLEFRAICISLWLGVPSYLYFAVARSSELFVFRCGLEFRALLISLWLYLFV